MWTGMFFKPPRLSGKSGLAQELNAPLVGSILLNASLHHGKAMSIIAAVIR
jgi:hypothetical protein